MYALAFGSNVWEMPVRPESLEVSYPARTAVTPTLTSAYADMFGPGIGAVNISGTTGWGIGARKGRPNGLRALKQLVELYENYLTSAAAAADPTNVRMSFVDGYLGNTFQVIPDSSGLRLSQNKSSPMLVRWSLTLVVIRDLSGGRAQGDGQITIGLLQSAAGSNQAQLAASYGAGALSALSSAPALTPKPQYYTVQSGDTLSLIAELYGVSTAEIKDTNGVRFAGRLQAGMVLTIPGQ